MTWCARRQRCLIVSLVLCLTGTAFVRPIYIYVKQGRIHGFLGHVRVSRGSDERDQSSSWTGAVTQKPPINAEKADLQADGRTDQQTERVIESRRRALYLWTTECLHLHVHVSTINNAVFGISGCLIFATGVFVYFRTSAPSIDKEDDPNDDRPKVTDKVWGLLI